MTRTITTALALLLCACGSSDGGDQRLPGEAPGWHTRAPLPAPRQEHGVAELDGDIYVVGGMDGLGLTLASAIAYDPASDSWREIAPLPKPIHHPGVAAANGRLYVLGGFNLVTPAFIALGDVYEYDAAANTWRARASLPAGRQRGAAAVGVIDGRIYLAGGQRNLQATTEFDVYDPVADQWTTLPDLPTAREHVAGAAVDGRFYAIGGRSGELHGEVEAYDPRTRQWQARAALPTPRGGGAAGVVNGRIIMVGGEGNDDSPRGVFGQSEIYDPGSDTWRALAPMLLPRHGIGAAGYQGRLHVPGGADREILGPTDVNDALTP
ncbi:kelch repeat-containing protein [Solimonas sp. K1W22B-7]|uniref:Kelch repeat-containing protein n=1 Tax=Solimonas sp. K1W22B-7 TaxID=2303331 RepID=UPI000E32F0CC|nr:kelch repeat-containing protein [Solimonas sp. K1W22B-7]AXQ30871.1 kelch repeat-containing protein [Solimonas sp. K1W22B-7]